MYKLLMYTVHKLLMYTVHFAYNKLCFFLSVGNIHSQEWYHIACIDMAFTPVCLLSLYNIRFFRNIKFPLENKASGIYPRAAFVYYWLTRQHAVSSSFLVSSLHIWKTNYFLTTVYHSQLLSNKTVFSKTIDHR